MYSRGKPEVPLINRALTDAADPEVIESRLPTEYELSWRIPADNGVNIDYYLIAYSLVRIIKDV